MQQGEPGVVGAEPERSGGGAETTPGSPCCTGANGEPGELKIQFPEGQRNIVAPRTGAVPNSLNRRQNSVNAGPERRQTHKCLCNLEFSQLSEFSTLHFLSLVCMIMTVTVKLIVLVLKIKFCFS